MNQLSKHTDKVLNTLSRRIGKAKKSIEEATNDHDKAWEEVSALFGEFSDEKIPRFLADDGFYLTLRRTERSPKLNVEMLQAMIFQEMGPRQANKLWKSITKLTVDTTALEAAVRMQKIPANIVERCMTPGTVSYSRIRDEWTADDRIRAEVFQIEKKEE